MKSRKSSGGIVSAALVFLAFPFLTGADGGGCSGGGIIPIGAGAGSDGGGGGGGGHGGVDASTDGGTCVVLPCAFIFCQNGYLNDSSGCPTCQCAPPTDAGSTGTACNVDSDCSNGGVCGFAESDGCSAVGSCFPPPGPVCLAYSPGCACDGTEISVGCTGLPSGYVSKPLAHTGQCNGSTGRPCTTSADCPNGGICGYLESAGCAATGECFPAPTVARCAIPSAVGCGCNGTDVSIDPSCYSGLPNGYQLHPVLHSGTCAMDAGGGCVSQRGGPCGGNTANPCTCVTGLTCTPGDSGLPFGDVGGTCE